MRRSLIAGNAKMNLDTASLGALLGELRRAVTAAPPAADVAYFPPYPFLAAARDALAGSPIAWGGQDLHWESEGAYTGEVSAAMLRDLGSTLVLVGHSERRQYFGETDESVRRKAGAALAADLVPVVCVGETEAEREAGSTEVVLSRQVVAGISGLPVHDANSLVLAYEPVWAIGTGRTATADQAQEAHRHLRGELAKVLGEPLAAGVRILYGGSVKPANAAELLSLPDVDGALVGGASLQAESFLGILRGAPVRG